MKPTIESAKNYLFDCNAFGFFSYCFDTSSTLNEHSKGLLNHHFEKTKRPRAHSWPDLPSMVPKPEMDVKKLMEEGMTKTKAQLCLFLIENRQVFSEATTYISCQWINQGKDVWKRQDLLDRYYLLAEWVFDENTLCFDVTYLEKAITEIIDIGRSHLPKKKAYVFPEEDYQFQHPLNGLAYHLKTILQERLQNEKLTFAQGLHDKKSNVFCFFKNNVLYDKHLSQEILQLLG